MEPTWFDTAAVIDVEQLSQRFGSESPGAAAAPFPPPSQPGEWHWSGYRVMTAEKRRSTLRIASSGLCADRPR
jgi:hypothetical protein